MPVWTNWRQDSELWLHASCSHKLLQRDGSHFTVLVEDYRAHFGGTCRFCNYKISVNQEITKVIPQNDYSFYGLQSHSNSWTAYVGKPINIWLPLDASNDPDGSAPASGPVPDTSNGTTYSGNSRSDSNPNYNAGWWSSVPYSPTPNTTSNSQPQPQSSSSSAPAPNPKAPVVYSNWGKPSNAAKFSSPAPQSQSTSAPKANVANPAWLTGWAPYVTVPTPAPAPQPASAPTPAPAPQSTSAPAPAAKASPRKQEKSFCNRATQTPVANNSAPIALPDLYVSASEGESSDGDSASKKDGKTK